MDGSAGGEVLPAVIPSWAVEAIVGAGRRMDHLGLVPATAGNISVRLADGRIAVTQSGGHKGFLTAANLMLVAGDGSPAGPGRPSAETFLHCQLYRLFPAAGAVLHGHSVPGTVLSMAAGDAIRFAGYEVIKAFAGQTTHEAAVDLPVFDNDQDIARLGSVAESRIRDARIGYYIRGHGAYVWGRDMQQSLVHLEALEFLLACELERRRR